MAAKLHINTGGPCECCGVPEGHGCTCKTAEMRLLKQEIEVYQELEEIDRGEMKAAGVRLRPKSGPVGSCLYEIKRLRSENEKLRGALLDAVDRPLGVVPASAAEFLKENG